ncbi:MAG: DUF3368 domain-containing protein [Gammaproteobacteria bacterium]|nr:DUF3368 domain-containing protein [Gammaproteobacteria bacterium]
MIVFSNTTPFIALSAIDKLSLMPRLFNEIYVVFEVVEECSQGGLIQVPPLQTLTWVKCIKSKPLKNKMILLELDKGEKYTIDMACQLKADKVIIDEKIGRNMAEYLNLNVIGTLGILLTAKQRGWISSFSVCVSKLQDKGLYYNSNLVKRLAQIVNE